MHLIFDNLVAIMVAGMLFLMLVGVNQRSRLSAVESSSYYAMKQQELNFVETLKRDMQNITALQTTKEDPTTLTFSFKARTDPSDTTSKTILYDRVYMGQQADDSLYQVRRYVNGAGDGGSMSTLVAWKIVAQNEEGVAVSDVANARQIFVRFEAISPFQANDDVDGSFKTGRTFDKSRWEATFRPPLIQQATSI